MSIEITDDQIEAIIISEMKLALEYAEDNDKGLKDALKKVLKYYMVHSAYVEEFGDE